MEQHEKRCLDYFEKINKLETSAKKVYEEIADLRLEMQPFAENLMLIHGKDKSE